MNPRLKSIIGGSTGNLVEWYDWYAYSAFTLYFAPHFFPAEDRTAQLLSAAAVFAVGFIMRPIGAWIMGVYADRNAKRDGDQHLDVELPIPRDRRARLGGGFG